MISDESVPLSQHDILSAEECRAVADRVIAHKSHWIERAPNSFYTLGAASYLDAPGQHAVYLASAHANNPVLRASFGDFLEYVREFFEDLLEETVFFDDQYALPGFHVHAFHGRTQGQDSAAPRAHFDLQWRHAMPGCVPDGTLSFTLLLDEPTGGASMAVWPIRYQEAARLGCQGRDYAMSHTPQVVAYARGRIVIHDGLVLHAIGSAPEGSKGLRITLQGHGVRFSRGWMLYW
jgi:hypothetical protein